MQASTSSAEEWLKDTERRAWARSQAYRRQLDRLWWVNLVLVVCPAVLSTAAAVFAALPSKQMGTLFYLPPAALFAGLAAVLLAIHKALKCEEYQAECLRLSQSYDAVAVAARSASHGSDGEKREAHKRLAEKLETLAEGAKAKLPASVMSEVEAAGALK